jgi:phosphate/sulfate permease
MIRATRGGGVDGGVDAAFVLAVVAILAFAFTNGFHDAANAIATLVEPEAPARERRSSSPRSATVRAASASRAGPIG